LTAILSRLMLVATVTVSTKGFRGCLKISERYALANPSINPKAHEAQSPHQGVGARPAGLNHMRL
jgi:hypothetical protein